MATYIKAEVPKSVARINEFCEDVLRWLNHSNDEYSGGWSMVAPPTPDHVARSERVLQCSRPQFECLIGLHFADSKYPDKVVLRPAMLMMGGQLLTASILGLPTYEAMAPAIADVTARFVRSSVPSCSELYRRQRIAQRIHADLKKQEIALSAQLIGFGMQRADDGSFHAAGVSFTLQDPGTIALDRARTADVIDPDYPTPQLNMRVHADIPIGVLPDLLYALAGGEHGHAKNTP